MDDVETSGCSIPKLDAQTDVVVVHPSFVCSAEWNNSKRLLRMAHGCLLKVIESTLCFVVGYKNWQNRGHQVMPQFQRFVSIIALFTADVIHLQV